MGGGSTLVQSVNVYTLPGQTADIEEGPDGLDIRIREMIEDEVPRVLEGQMADPNSRASGAFSSNFEISRRR